VSGARSFPGSGKLPPQRKPTPLASAYEKYKGALPIPVELLFSTVLVVLRSESHGHSHARTISNRVT
jgi:hypothetical protein